MIKDILLQVDERAVGEQMMKIKKKDTCHMMS